MKRLVLTTTATVAGLAALLSFKSQAQPPAPAQASASATVTTGAETSTGKTVTTRYGIVQVEVTVTGSRIEKVAFAQLTGFDGHSRQINSWAGPQLLQQTLRNQSSQVDTVSGASYTSEGYRESLQSALDRAGIA